MGLPPLFSVDDNSKKVLAITHKVYGSSARASGAQAQLMLRSPLELIANGDGFCGDTTGWAAYDDGAAAKPLDGTGGAPSTLTLAASVVAGEILTSQAVLKLSKSAASGQGEGIAHSFTLPAARPSTVHEIDLWYLGSANFAINGGTPASPSDIIWYLYDVTAGALIEPLGYVLDGSGHQKMYFQSKLGSTSYRLIAHVATTNASAWDYFFSVSVSPAKQVQNVSIADPIEYTLTIGATTTAPTLGTTTLNRATYTRVGKYALIQYQLTQTSTGTSGSGTYLFPLPAGLTIDPDYFSASSAAVSTSLGSAGIYTVDAAKAGAGLVKGYNATNLALAIQTDTSALTDVGSTFFALGTASAQIAFTAFVPIQGWGGEAIGTTQDLKQISAVYNGQPTGTINGSFNIATYPTKISDDTVLYVSGSATITSPGKYDIAAGMNITGTFTATQAALCSIFVNSTEVARGKLIAGNALVTDLSPNVNIEAYPLIAGDVVTIQSNTDATGPAYGNTPSNYFSISKRSGSSVVVPSGKTVASYKTSAAQSIPNATATVVDFGTLVSDLTGSVTTGASWKFTAKEAMSVFVHSMVHLDTTTVANFEIDIRKNGSSVANKQRDTVAANKNNLELTKVIDLAAGDYVDVTVFHQVGASTPLQSSALRNYIDIFKVGV